MRNLNQHTDSFTQLTLTNIALTISNKRLLHDIGVTINNPGVTAIVGFNGAGKSMLLKIMHGIVKPSAGTVNWGNTTDIAVQQAMVFQKPVLLRRSAIANVKFAIKNDGASNAKARHELAMELLERVGLHSKAKQPARLLSGGEQQRLALARALAVRPAVLFLDEATSSLDPASTATIENIVAEQSANGTKVIMVTHDSAQAQRLADSIIFVCGGRVTEHTNAIQFFDEPTSDPAKAYLAGQLYY